MWSRADEKLDGPHDGRSRSLSQHVDVKSMSLSGGGSGGIGCPLEPRTGHSSERPRLMIYRIFPSQNHRHDFAISAFLKIFGRHWTHSHPRLPCPVSHLVYCI